MNRSGGGLAPHRPRWTWDELAWALGFALALATLTTVPYLWGAAQQPYGLVYLGFVFNPDEPNVHLSWIRQAAEGACLLRNGFTSEPHDGRFFNLFMLGAGRLAHWLHATPYQVWAALRVLCAGALTLGVYAALAGFTHDRKLRRLGTLVVTLSSGLGWLWVSCGSRLDPVDVEPGLVMPEALTFLTLYLNPLFALSMLLLLGALLGGERALRTHRVGPALAAGVLGGLLANVHTYDTIPLGAVLTAYLLALAVRERRWCWRRCGLWALIALLVAPGVAWQANLIRSDALYAAKANTITGTPALRVMLISYGLLVPLAVVGAWGGLRRRREAVLFWTLWAAVHFACIFLPTSSFPFQRKMAEGLHLPLAVLAAAGLQASARWLGRRLAWRVLAARRERFGALWSVRQEALVLRQAWARRFAALGVVALLPSNALFVLDSLGALRNNNQSKLHMLMPPLYLPAADLDAVRWLGANLPADAVVLCLPFVGNYVPGLTGRTVYLGHWAETIGFEQKLRDYQSFVRDPRKPAEKLAFLRAKGITHVFVGSYEQAAAGGRWPVPAGLERIYPAPAPGTPPVAVYRVPPASPEAAPKR